RVVELVSSTRDLEQLALVVQLEPQRGRELVERPQNTRKLVVAKVSDDAEADHSAIASLSNSALTRFAIPGASSPHAAGWRARGAARITRSGTPCTATRTDESYRPMTLDMNAPKPLTTVPSSTTRICLWSARTAASVISSYGLRKRQLTTETLSPS